MMVTDADVIIVGAGPAGAIAAYTLARQDISVIVLEKSIFPRYKVCGGGLTHKILEELPFPITDIIETSISTVRFSHKLAEVFSRTSADPFIYCTMRSRLDNAIAEQAGRVGAKFLFGQKVNGIRQDKTFVEVITDKNKFTSRFIIGAEGASSTVARLLNLRENIEPGIAWEAEIKAGEQDMNAFSQTVFLDWGTFPGGYGWVFPKNDHFSIGVGGPAFLSKKMIPYYESFVQSTGIHFRETLSMKSWPIPVRTKEGRFHRGLGLTAGDAAGLTDPLTGEGIFYAVKSGKFAAEACSGYLNGKNSSLEQYSELINETIMRELMEAYRIRNIFNTVPGKIHRLVRDNDRVWRGFCKVLRGERNYQDVRNGFGKFKSLWNMTASISSFLYRRKEMNFRETG